MSLEANTEFNPNDIHCIRCNSTNTKKRGFDRVDGSQLHTCKDCGKTFNINAAKVKHLLNIYSEIECEECGCMKYKTHHVKRDEFDLVCEECSDTERIDLESLTKMIGESLEETTGINNTYYDESSTITEESWKKLNDNHNPSISKLNDSELKELIEELVNINPIQEPLPKQAPIDLIEEEPISPEYTAKEIVRLAKSRQFNMDKNRVERKIVRDHFRKDNTVEELEKNLIKILTDGFDLSVNNADIKTIKNENKEVMGILQLSDLHFNEIVYGVYSNSYDFEVASKRLKLFVDKAIKIFKSNGVNSITIAMTGDIVNNNVILDKKINMEYNKTYAMLIACHLIENMIFDLLNNEFLVSVATVVGNESRMNLEHAFSNKAITDNYDFCIHNILNIMFKNVKNVKFIGGRFDEKVLNVNGINFLMVHKAPDNQNGIQSVIGRYSAMGISVSYIMSGHIHLANLGVSDIAFRSSSLVGNNNYSAQGLNLFGRASQNIYLVSKTGVDAMKIDLQDVTGVVGYPLQVNLMDDIQTKSVNIDDVVMYI